MMLQSEVMSAMMVVIRMIKINILFSTSGFLSPLPDTEKLGFAGVLLRLILSPLSSS